MFLGWELGKPPDEPVAFVLAQWRNVLGHYPRAWEAPQWGYPGRIMEEGPWSLQMVLEWHRL